ncbi:MAG: hypothetical protein KGK12_01040 [Armatimonadetes bacterium]|nr:hypothetical protein [Armatimonadota bacterium]
MPSSLTTAAVRTGGIKNFWGTLKSVSVRAIAQEAERPVSIAIVGPSEERAALAAKLLEHSGARRLIAPTESQKAVHQYDTLGEAARVSPAADITIDLSNNPMAAEARGSHFNVVQLGGWPNTLHRILDERPELALALARRFPAFRPHVVAAIIADTAAVNAQFALLTGIAEAIPFSAILLPVNSISDMVVLTKNQVMMVMKLAAANGLTVDFRRRSSELGPVLANGFGWRAIARELVGAVPFVGFLARASIAYAGTVTVGKGAQYYYENGAAPSSDVLRSVYQDALKASQGTVQALAARIRAKRGQQPRRRGLTEVRVHGEPRAIEAAPPPEQSDSH